MSNHDPLDRQKTDEARFVLLARDVTASDLVRLWMALRKRDESLIDAIVKRLKVKMARLPYQPNKDEEHIRSAQAVANNMDIFLMERTQGNVRDTEQPL